MNEVNRVYETNRNTYGSLMTIVEYNHSKDITVEFENGYRVKSRYGDFKKGNIKSPYDKTVFNVGRIEEGNYKVSIEGKHTIQYNYWYNMLKRCYDEVYISKHSTYEDKYVCEEWHNYQTFAKWFDENYYECNGERMELDKDILCKGNKIYSEETCVFVPQRINKLFLRQQNKRGEYPIGITLKGKKFFARCSVLNKENKKERIALGVYNTPEEAFYKYKEFKEQYIKEIAEQYKDKIPQKLYDAMCKYVININD